jgi:hypothetical protein
MSNYVVVQRSKVKFSRKSMLAKGELYQDCSTSHIEILLKPMANSLTLAVLKTAVLQSGRMLMDQGGSW